MNTVASIRTFGAGVIITSVEDDKQIKEEKYPTWNFDSTSPIRFRLTYDQEKLFAEILHSNKGKEILSNLKNSKTNEIINSYLEDYRKKISRDKSLDGFITKVICEPLVGRNRVSLTTVGLTKREIWSAFVENGLTNI